MTTPDMTPLLRAVLLAPADDGLRLIYADALDEAGDHDRAEFIRVQCELAEIPARETYSREPHWIPRGEPAYKEWQRQDALRARESRLADLHCNAHGGWASEYDLLLAGWTMYVGDQTAAYHGPSVRWRRGLIAEVEADWEWYRDSAAVLFSNCPVQCAFLVDKRPQFFEFSLSKRNKVRGWSWISYVMDDEPDAVPSAVLETAREVCPQAEKYPGRLVYDSEAEAVAALSDLLVEYGRRRAGLESL